MKLVKVAKKKSEMDKKRKQTVLKDIAEKGKVANEENKNKYKKDEE
jgi:hypothetical protein